ncbi:Uncharacterised protein [Mycobacteroides abscessus subsp. bolletii]|nr:Uncharacterised protein [Mycobacteroides abscessus subsp. bolletii]
MIQIYPLPWCYEHGAFHHSDDCPKGAPSQHGHVIANVVGFVSLTTVIFIFIAGMYFLAGGR